MENSFKRIIRIPSRRELQHANIEGKRILARFDFNLPCDDGRVEDASRIDLAMPTIQFILSKKALELNIITHFGRPKDENDQQFSTSVIAEVLAKKLALKPPVMKENEGAKSPVLKKYFQIGERVKLFENLRFDTREDDNSAAFADELSSLGDIFVQDAFANIHRNHTSMVALQKKLPTYAGLLLNKEVNTLFRILNNPERLFVAIIGGAKIEDKLPVIEALAKIADYVILGGMTANEWILFDKPRKENIYFPTDGIAKSGSIVPINKETLKEGIFDIGPQTIMLYKSILSPAKTVFWNGNLGMTEEKKFAHGTNEIARFIAKLKANTIASGGNTIQVVDELELADNFSFISSGGGATSDFVCSKKMPALELLLE
ncbi:MAG: Phosphoglycerate kinase [candidate division WS2 bacterium ADurb.Bin280]|uniref:Phosphoglycerate kinase n=1 Tax=candidate division WS2 bacterium ADurb.Bin280 TaxID=1852829 RepID=A0A1V5SBN9_9BACT|nr:MAG: Phosphoglycerate kinase [candidate division WS2 bacterium ADurb.Bin280]